jgi:hypothetical protein
MKKSKKKERNRMNIYLIYKKFTFRKFIKTRDNEKEEEGIYT